VLLRALLLDADLFLADLGLGGALPAQPARVLLLQGVDLLRGEGLGDPAAGEPGDGDAQPCGDHGPGVRAVAPQLLEPRGRIGLQGGQFGARDDALLELGGGGLEVHTQLLRRGGGLHGLGGLVRRHASRVSSVCATSDHDR
jgi:hypothetical protein